MPDDEPRKGVFSAGTKIPCVESSCDLGVGFLYPFGDGHTFAGIDCVVDWMHEQDFIAVRAS